jgi:hypothetical protein
MLPIKLFEFCFFDRLTPAQTLALASLQLQKVLKGLFCFPVVKITAIKT